MTDREALGFLKSVLDGIDDKGSMVMVLNHERMKQAIQCAVHALMNGLPDEVKPDPDVRSEIEICKDAIQYLEKRVTRLEKFLC